MTWVGSNGEEGKKEREVIGDLEIIVMSYFFLGSRVWEVLGVARIGWSCWVRLCRIFELLGCFYRLLVLR